ncbi:MAG: helix-turn-helix domain-containing protein [Phycisphaerales bacterium]|nr:helix-turn-helix domain-containing protein [Phycisphaerales bacterium]
MSSHFSEDQVQQSWPLDKVLYAVGGGPRPEIIQSLIEAPKFVSAIADELELAIGTISHHLAILKRHSLVRSEAIGLHHVYGLTNLVRASRHGKLLRVRIDCAAGERVILHRCVN